MYKTIQEDTRHIDVSVLFEDTIEKRMFPDWAMGYKNLNKDELANIPGLTQFLTDTKTATPYELLLQFRNNPAQFN